MSLILDALRKSDRERNRAATEQLRWAPGPARSSGPGQLVVGLVIALVLVLAGAIGIWLGGQLASRAEIAAGDNEIMENKASGEPRKSVSGEVRSLSGELAARRVETPAVSVEAADNDSGVRPESSEPVVNDVILHAPALSEMPEEYRADLPTLTINVHAWTEQPGQRFILINMQRYTEGDRLREGPLVRQITPHGVVLEHRGEIFSLSQR